MTRGELYEAVLREVGGRAMDVTTGRTEGISIPALAVQFSATEADVREVLVAIATGVRIRG